MSNCKMTEKIKKLRGKMIRGTLALALLAAVLLPATHNAFAIDAPAGSKVLKNELFETAAGYIRSHSPWQENQVTINLKYVNELPVPDQDIRLEVKDFVCSKPWGTILVPVTVYVNNKTWRRVQVYVNINMVATVAMAVQNIRYQEEINSTNVKFIKMPLANVPVNSVITPRALQNARAKGSVLAGKIITAAMVEQTPDVKRGEQVALSVNCNGITACTLGQAKEDGYIGNKVKVVNMSTKKILVGVVKEKGLIELVN
jgi:flagellar basal body P-ring formation protein FlgA